MKSFRDLYRSLKIDLSMEVEDILGEAWEDSQSRFERHPRFLDESIIDESCRYLGLSDTVRLFLFETARVIDANENACRLIWHFHYFVVENHRLFSQKAKYFPELPSFNEYSRAFYLLLALSGISYFGRVEDVQDISRAEIQSRIDEFKSQIETSIQDTQRIGVPPQLSGWYEAFFP
jgi:hypothetical protein